ncbi:ParB N-terminal domain-containing protein [Natronorarus salvus]|uniref:hypothetical protein n=1 Tax=Natronorarus salvus TaxID=3117733 RepID=UPI002F260DD5
MAVRELPSRAVGKWREDGFVALLSAASSRVRQAARRVRVRRAYRRTSLGADVIDVDPGSITHFLIEGRHPATSYRTEKGLITKHELSKAYFPVQFFGGRVVPGEWDRHRKPYRFDRVYSAFADHYLDGVDWMETEYAQHMLLMGELYDVQAVEQRIGICESLYRSMLRDGYEPSSDPTRNVPVNVGRDGTLIFNNWEGHHRLALAKVLGIDRIPVFVVVRHERWEAIREVVASAASVDDLDERERRHLDHPDVRPLHEFDRRDRPSNSPRTPDTSPWSAGRSLS